MKHPLTGRKQTSEHIAKRVESIRLAKSLWSVERNEQFRKAVSVSAKGRPAWNKGKPATEDMRKANSEAHKGLPSGAFGKHHTDEAREKNRQAHLGIKQTPELIQKRVDARMGYVHSEEVKKRIRETNIKTWSREEIRLKTTGENSPSWLGGISFEPYPVGWTRSHREKIRERDGYCCQNCGIAENLLNAKLSIHHIDYEKKNISPNNLISLCNSCHIKTNHGREYWTVVFRNVLNSYTNQQLMTINE